MLCPGCRTRVDREAGWCGRCGRPLGDKAAPLELVLPDATRVPLLDEVVIGRAAGSTLRLPDPSVSRRHARIAPGPDGCPQVEDAGSSHGTFLDGERVTAPRPLRDGALLAVGDQHLEVRRRRDDAGAGRTIVVPPAASLVAGAVSPDAPGGAVSGAERPRLRAGYALKRLPAGEGERRWTLRDLTGAAFLRLGRADAELLELLDGSRTLAELVAEAEARYGRPGPARLARLLADLGDRGLIAGVAGAAGGAGRARGPARPGVRGRLERIRDRLAEPREWTTPRLAGVFERGYRRGGWVLGTRPALAGAVVACVAGLAAFVACVAGRYGTPFVVADRIGLGGAVFLAGRFALVAAHESAHGLALAAFGRRVGRAGIKLVVVLPYAVVDTSEAWFEPRRRRMAVAAAGPAADLVLGGLFAVGALALDGAVRDVLFQLAFAAYVGALFTLNPFLDRDGYHLLVDALREPGLRRRARAQLARRLSGGGRGAGDSRVLARYAVAGIAWSLVAAAFVVVLSLRYVPVLDAHVPPAVVWSVLGAVWLAVLVPVVAVVGPPLVQRARPGRVAAVEPP